MSLDTAGILDQLTSHAAKLPSIDRLTRHEPKNAPGKGVTWALFLARLDPAAYGSGLAATTVRVEFTARFYMPMRSEPQDEIDPRILEAVDALFAAYHGDFTLSGKAQAIDLLGKAGTPLSAVAGYLDQDQVMQRIVDVVIPVIVNDVWEQVA